MPKNTYLPVKSIWGERKKLSEGTKKHKPPHDSSKIGLSPKWTEGDVIPEEEKAKKRSRELYVAKENSETSLSLSSFPTIPDYKDLSFRRRIANRIGPEERSWSSEKKKKPALRRGHDGLARY